MLSVDFFACKNKRSATERAKDAWKFILHSFSGGGSLGDGGLYGTEQEKNMFYTYILRSIAHPEQRYIGSTSDLKARLAIRRFFCKAKKERSDCEGCRSEGPQAHEAGL